MRASRAMAALLGLIALASAIPTSVPAKAQASAVNVHADAERLWIDSPYLHLELNARRPALEVIRVAPRGDRQFGPHIGTIVEEATSGDRRLRSAGDDANGARTSWVAGRDGVRIRVEGIDTGDLTTTTWVIAVPNASPSLRIERQVSLRGQPVDTHGLVIVSPGFPEGIEPSSIARMLGNGSYRPEVGPRLLDLGGSLVGILAVDHPELSFSAREEQPDRVTAMQEGDAISLGLVQRPVQPQSSGSFSSAVVVRFGWDNDYLLVRSDANPDLERRLLASGYYGNAVISPVLGAVLSASMRDYRGQVWSRDFDYAIQGYGYVLHDMSVFRNNLEKFLERVDDYGVAPETVFLDGQYVNRESWDSMANVIQATYTLVSKTGDLEFYQQYETPVKKALQWIRALDENGNGLPDHDIFPYGYTDTVENGPMHTYAIAKHYAAFLAVAELEEALGRDASQLRAYAETMRQSFRLPLSQGGYWNPDTGYPIAWKRASGQVFTTFETFGVFEAIRVGLMNDPDQLRSVASFMNLNRDAFINTNAYPERLMIGGYDLETKKDEVPQEKLWIMDANAPWITGISVPARVQLGLVEDASAMLAAYASSADRPTPHGEFGAGPMGAYGPGETNDGGRLWDNWSWFNAVYGTHFGITMTPRWMTISPTPLHSVAARRLVDVSYQGALLNLTLHDGGYQFTLDAPRQVLAHPPFGFTTIDVNGDGNYQPNRVIRSVPGTSYLIRGRR